MKIRRILAALSLSTLAVFGLDAPAQANTVHGCAENTVCLMQNTNYGLSTWSNSFNWIYQKPNNCLDIGNVNHWPNGTLINNNSWSLVVNGDPSPTNVWSHYTIYIFNLPNCNVDGGVDTFPGSGESSIPNLSCCYYVNNTGVSLRQTISSMELIPST